MHSTLCASLQAGASFQWRPVKGLRQDGIMVMICFFKKSMTNYGRNVDDELEEMEAGIKMANCKSHLHPLSICWAPTMC